MEGWEEAFFRREDGKEDFFLSSSHPPGELAFLELAHH
jgi:hypothetical protein